MKQDHIPALCVHCGRNRTKVVVRHPRVLRHGSRMETYCPSCFTGGIEHRVVNDKTLRIVSDARGHKLPLLGMLDGNGVWHRQQRTGTHLAACGVSVADDAITRWDWRTIPREKLCTQCLKK